LRFSEQKDWSLSIAVSLPVGIVLFLECEDFTKAEVFLFGPVEKLE